MIAFHSYKGGVGRTKVMVAVGAILASRGYRVGMLDFDLDSSGLIMMLEKESHDIQQEDLLSILGEYKLAKPRLMDIKLIDKSYLVNERLKENIQDKYGCLRYLPTKADPEKSNQINLGDIAAGGYLDSFIEKVKVNGKVNTLLFDLKPGYSPSFSVIMPRVDRAVIVSRLDTQCIVGMGVLVPMLNRWFKKGKLTLVVNMVPKSARSEKNLQKLKEVCKQNIDIIITYDAELLFDDDFEFLGDKSSPLRENFEKLADILVEPVSKRTN